MLFMRDSLGRLVPVNPGLPARQGNQGGMGAILSERDLMSRLPNADIAGAIGPGVVPGGDQAVGARRARLEAENATPPAPTYRPLGGAQQNNRGNFQVVTLLTSTGGPAQRVASVVETPKACGDDAEVIAIQLGLELPGVMTDPAGIYQLAPIDVTCLLEWGIGGASFSAELDWAQGTCFTVGASFVRVSALIAAMPAIGAPDIPIVLKAALAYGNSQSLATSSPARRTLSVGTGAFGAPPILNGNTSSALFPIPAWAMGFTLVDGGPNNVPDYTVLLTDGSVGVVTTEYRVADRTNLGNQVEGQFPIPSRARFIQVTNNLAVGANSPQVVFNLGF